MQTKKEKSPILVICAIFILAIFIVLPPLFRVMYPREEITKEKPVTTKKMLLTCTNKATVDGYEVTSKVRYVDGVPERNTITYTKITTTTTPPTNSKTPVQTRTALEELNFFNEIEGIEVTEGMASTIVSIKKDSITTNEDNLELANYFLPLKEQEEFYKEQGYDCSNMEL